MLFWIIAILAALLVAALLARPLLRRSAAPQDALDFDLKVYRDQLAEVESDLDRGILGTDEAERVRAEIKRRILEADRASNQTVTGPTSQRAGLLLAGVVTVLVVGGSLALYDRIGAGGAADMPLAGRADSTEQTRRSQAEVEALIGDATEMEAAADPSYIDLVDKLRDTVATRPDDVTGHQLLADHEARLGHFAAAHKAMARVIELKGDKATADDYTGWAELMIVAAGGYVSPAAERALAKSVRLDPSNPRTRYYSGLDLAQNGRADLAYRLWSDLLAEGPEDAPWIAPIREQIAEVARMAGIGQATPGNGEAMPGNGEAMPGPDQDQIRDGQALPDAEQQEMIRGMVARLAERLAAEGGSAAEWARLIRAYGVLGEADKAGKVWAEAQSTFAADSTGLAEIAAAARDAGVAE